MARSKPQFPEPMETYNRIERRIVKWVESASLSRAIAYCEKELASLPSSPYQKALGRTCLSQLDEAVEWLASFYRTAGKRFDVRAIYCEMNRFEINTDRWYVDGFAYDAVPDPNGLDWLCKWKKSTDEKTCLELRGMTDLQKLFARDYADVPPRRVVAASECAILLLTLRMQELIHTATLQARHGGRFPKFIPVWSAAHDSNMICVT
jgi:hypothetical protein